jgi:tetratricopeptide (TPR) repeat protein
VALAELEARMAAPGIREQFEGLQVPGAAGLLGRFIAPAALVRRAVDGAALLTDDQSSIEYSTSRAMFTYLQPRTIAWVEELRRAPLPPEAYPGMDARAVERARESRRRIAGVIAAEAERRSARELLELLARETGGMGDDEPTREHFERFAYQARLDARFLRAAGKLDEAIRALAAVPQASRHYVDALFERATAAQAAGRPAEGERLIREIVTSYPDSFAATCIRAQASEGAGRAEEAVGRWRTATVLRPDSDFAFAHLGVLLARLGRPDEAREACRKALDLEPENRVARQVLEKLGKP